MLRQIDCYLAWFESYLGRDGEMCGMAQMADRVSQEIQIPIIDGVRAAVKLVESLHGMGIKTSKWGDYDYPLVK